MSRPIFRAAVIQDNLEVAYVESAVAADVEREIIHYAAVYKQDGPVEITRSPALRRWLSSGDATKD
jgi:hypothetical protein